MRGARMDDGERRRRFGTHLAQLRRARGMSQRQLAESLGTVSGVPSVTRHEVSRWERGGRIPASWLPLLAREFGVPQRELERAAAVARGGWCEPGPAVASTLAELLPPPGALPAPSASGGRRVGYSEVSDLASRVHGLRLADDVLAGGDLVAPAFREFDAATKLYRGSSHSETVGHALLVQIGELAQIAGWIASDAGRWSQAQRVYTTGLTAARQAGDAPLAGHLLGSLAYQLSNTGQERRGLALARTALAEAGPHAPAKTRALFFDRVAWAHARTGEAKPALRALVDAHEALATDSGDATAAPQWAYWVNDSELDVMDARVYTELRRPLRAVPLLTEVMSRYDATHARETALYRSWLTVALTDANEPEQAAAEGRHVLELSGGVASERTAARCRTVLRRLSDFPTVPQAAELLADYGHLLPS